MKAGARRAEVVRKTRETDIRLALGLDGEGRSRIATGTSRRRTKSVASWAAISPAPTRPIFRIGRGSASGRPGGRFARRSTRSKA